MTHVNVNDKKPGPCLKKPESFSLPPAPETGHLVNKGPCLSVVTLPGHCGKPCRWGGVAGRKGGLRWCSCLTTCFFDAGLFDAGLCDVGSCDADKCVPR